MDQNEWLPVERGLDISTDQTWLRQVADDGSFIFIKTKDKSIWCQNEKGQLLQLEDQGDSGIDKEVAEHTVWTDDYEDTDQNDTSSDNEVEEDDGEDEEDLDLAEIVSTAYYRVDNDCEQECSSYLISKVFLPIDAYTKDSTLSVCHGVAIADGSNRTAEVVCESLPKNTLSAFHSLWAKRQLSLWSINTSKVSMSKTNLLVWDTDICTPVFEEGKSGDMSLNDIHTVVMVEAMLKSFRQTSQNVANNNISRKEFGGCSALMVNLYGPCNDGALRAVVGSLGNLGCCLVKKDLRIVELLPPSPRTLTKDYLPKPTKLRKEGVKVDGHVLRIEDYPQVVCTLSRGFGHVQLMCRKSAGGNLLTDLTNSVIKRNPDIALLQIDPDEDSLILVATNAVLKQSSWRALAEVALSVDPIENLSAGHFLQVIELFTSPLDQDTCSVKKARIDA